MAIAKLTAEGRITLPKEIREYLNIEAGSYVEIMIDSEGAVVVAPISIDIKSLKGILSRQLQSQSTADIKKDGPG